MRAEEARRRRSRRPGPSPSTPSLERRQLPREVVQTGWLIVFWKQLFWMFFKFVGFSSSFFTLSSDSGRTVPSTFIGVVPRPTTPGSPLPVMLKTSITICKPDPHLSSPLPSRANAPNRTAAARRRPQSACNCGALVFWGICFSELSKNRAPWRLNAPPPPIPLPRPME